MAEPVIILVDNGSTRAAASMSLRAIAGHLTQACGRPVHPVSLQHADRIPAQELGGEKAPVLPGFLRDRLERGEREFITLPLFFGRSRALTSFIPEQVALLVKDYGDFSLRQAEVLSPMPQGEPRLAQILAEHVHQCSAGAIPDRVIVVDHGSPLPEVTAVRAQVAMALRDRLPAGVSLGQAVMERRSGPEYDFNGQLLGELLDSSAIPGRDTLVVLAMLFISPGRHAGPGGDIEQICREAEARNPGLRVCVSPLVGEHPLLIDILRDRLEAVL
jgi:sirohydrochlorin ferrochelatase